MSFRLARPLLLGLSSLVLATAARADLLYSFNYTAQAGPIESFSFSFTAPDFVAGGASPSLTPFTVTDGTQDWTISEDAVAAQGAVGCFMFGMPGVQFGGGPPPFGGPCTVSSGTGSLATLDIFTAGGLPAAAGTYSAASFSGSFSGPAGLEFIEPITGTFHPSGTMTLTITQVAVPEPSFLGYLALELPALCGAFLLRRRQTLRDVAERSANSLSSARR